MFKGIRYAIQSVKEMSAAKEVLQRRFVMYKTSIGVGTKGDTAILDNVFVRAHGLQFAAILIYSTGEHEIYVDDAFIELSPETQQFVIEHERGHMVMKHKSDLKKRRWATLTGKVYMDEIEADAYAVFVIGKEAVLNGLKELYEITHDREIKRRIKLVSKSKG